MRRSTLNGSVTVKVSADEVVAFGRMWPCSGLVYRPVTFVFDDCTGDLLDTDADRHQPDADPSAITALSEDAWKAV